MRRPLIWSNLKMQILSFKGIKQRHKHIIILTKGIKTQVIEYYTTYLDKSANNNQKKHKNKAVIFFLHTMH